jgi:hypothetical protein
VEPGARGRYVTGMKTLVIATIGACALAGPALANNSACFGDPTRTEISCRRLDQSLLLHLRGATRDQVIAAMDAPGRPGDPGWLHFLSNYLGGSGSGDLNVKFEDGRVTIINASVDGSQGTGDLKFVWNAYAPPSHLKDDFDPATKDFGRAPYCSDLSRSGPPCETKGIDEDMMLTKMEFGSSRSDLLEMLDASCAVPGVIVSDPAGDCDRIRRELLFPAHADTQ